jgi:hypothetical protein
MEGNYTSVNEKILLPDFGVDDKDCMGAVDM